MLTNVESYGTERIIGLLGDTHGNTESALESLNVFAELGITHIAQLGDFGVWPNHESFLQKVQKTLKRYGQILAVTLGNHENYPRLERTIDSVDFPGWRALIGYPSILFAPRVHRFTWGDRDILSVGGANSIDRYLRTPNVDWWADEQITMGDVYRAQSEGRVSLMFTHDCPAGVPLFGGHKTGPNAVEGYGRKGAKYAEESREALRAITDVVQPELLTHGHYHFFADYVTELETPDGEGYTMRSVGLSRDTQRKDKALLDLETLELTVLD